MELVLEREDVLEISLTCGNALKIASLLHGEVTVQEPPEVEELRKKVHDEWDGRVLCTRIKPNPPERGP